MPGPYAPAIADVCQLLETHGGRLTFRALAAALGVPVDEIRRQVEAYADLDSVANLDRYYGASAYFLVDPADPADPEAPPCDDDFLNLKTAVKDVLGIEQFDATVLGPLYQAAEQLLLEEPDNEPLAAATILLRERFLPGVHPLGHFAADQVAVLSRAIQEHRRIRIVYSRAWRPGVVERVIEPYQMNYSSRGAEIDAGPIDDEGEIRTYLVARIRELEPLDETFEVPQDAIQRCIRARELTSVTGYVPHAGRWSIEKWAERVDVLRQDDEGLTFRAQLLPPVDWRCALILLMAGLDASLDDDALDASAADLAGRLLTHHGLEDGA